ncbi:MAG: low-specificity L-threonine aldolase [Candidatus Marinimicrobia bacterium]|nr:low-specificity L-threonine aldolase [Candidatus Neomarinimicrobiota bacterium]
MIDLRSDTVTLPSHQMKSFLMDAPLGDDVYGEDPSINELEKKIANLFGKDKALFVPSGTMANLISVLTHCERSDEVLLGNKSHIFKYEAGGISAFGGIHSHQLKNNDDGTINIEDIKNNIRDNNDAHYPKTGLVCLENTHNLCYGAPINNEYVKSVKTILNKTNIKLHIDGARIFNASIALNKEVKDLAKYADSITCCLSKGLSSPVGSLIISNNNFINKAHKLRKALGGGMRQAGILAACGLFSIKNMIKRLKEDHENAKELAIELNSLEEIKINLKNVHTNLIFFDLNSKDITSENFIKELLNYNIKIDYKGNNRFRMVTHYGFERKHIIIVIKTLKKIFKK